MGSCKSAENSDFINVKKNYAQIARYLTRLTTDLQTTFMYVWACGAMDNASDYGSEDSRFDSW